MSACSAAQTGYSSGSATTLTASYRTWDGAWGRPLSEALLPNVVETIAQALKVPYVAVAGMAANCTRRQHLDGPPPTWSASPLVYQGEDIGTCLAPARCAQGEASKADMDLLRSIAHEAGMAAHLRSLTADLQRSAPRYSLQRRRRLRRDLHDGLGPVLGGSTLKLDAARTSDRRSRREGTSCLVDLAHTQSAMATSAPVYDQSPALDDLGLASALQEHAAQCNSPDGLHVTVELPEHLPPLSAAVEVATYRIAQEAINNVVPRRGQELPCASLSIQDCAWRSPTVQAYRLTGIPESASTRCANAQKSLAAASRSVQRPVGAPEYSHNCRWRTLQGRRSRGHRVARAKREARSAKETDGNHSRAHRRRPPCVQRWS